MFKQKCDRDITNEKSVLIKEFIDRSTFKGIGGILCETKILEMNDLPFVSLNLSDIGKEKKRLLVIGDLSDLSQNATIGLFAHLCALLYMEYDKKLALKKEAWLRADLRSDEIAREWGFKMEVDELRKIRPQKIPVFLQYNNVILDHSVADLGFKEDMESILLADTLPNFHKKNRILFTGKFSMVCNVERLKKERIANLIIVSSNYYKNKAELKNLLSNL